MEDEVKRLKLKINKQIDALEEKDEQIKQLESKLESLTEVNLELSRQVEDETKKSSLNTVSTADLGHTTAEDNDIVCFFIKFGEIVKKIHKSGQFIPYKNATKYSGSFCKVERNIFENYVSEVATDTSQEFISQCKGFLCIKSEENGKCVFNNDKIRVYYLNRHLVNVILGNISNENQDIQQKVVS